MTEAPLRVAVLGMGWWSDVLADAIKRSKRARDRRLLHALAGQAPRLRGEVRLPRRRELRGDPGRPLDRGDRQHHAQQRAPGDHPAGGRRPASTCSSTSRSPTRCAKGMAIAEVCKTGRRRAGARLSAPPREPFPLDQEPRSTPAASASWCRPKCNISRDRLGQFDLSSWRYQAAGMPGGVMLQIGIHYVDVLEMLMGPVKRVSAHARPAGAARRQSRRRQPDPRARERRDLQPDRVLCVGVRVST